MVPNRAVMMCWLCKERLERNFWAAAEWPATKNVVIGSKLASAEELKMLVLMSIEPNFLHSTSRSGCRLL